MILRGRLVSGDGLVPDGVVEVRDGRIGYVGPVAGWSGSEAPWIGTITPGLIDIHCHGGGGHSFSSADAGGVAAAAAHHAERGTTTVVASLVSAPAAELSRSLALIASLVESGTTSIVGSHLEGPWLDHGHCGAHDPDHLALPDDAVARQWLRAARGTLVMVTMAPELHGAGAVGRQLEQAGVIVAAGHTGADEATFRRAISQARTPLVTHLFNGMAGLHHREPGPVGAALGALAAGDVAVEVIADGTHLDPAIVRMVFAMDPGAHVVLVSDAMVAAGMPDGPYQLGSLDVAVREGTAWTTSEPPALAGSTSHLADVLRHSISVAMIEPTAAVAAATATPARLLGLRDRGRLATGLRADLTIFSEDWRVRGSIREGVPQGSRLPVH